MVVLGVVGAVLLATVSALWLYVRWKKTKDLPPGPRGFKLLISHYLLGKPLHIEFSDLKEKYGELISIMCWARPVIILNSAHTIDQALRHRGFTFTGRSGPLFRKGLKFRQNNQAINISESDEWKLLHPVLAKGLDFRMDRLSKTLEKSMENEIAKSSNIRDFCFSYCLNLFSRLFIGEMALDLCKEEIQYIYAVEHSFIWHYLHDNEIYTNGMRNYRAALNKVDEFIWTSLQKLREQSNTDMTKADSELSGNHLLSRLADEDLSDEEIVANLSTLMVYAVVSTAIQMEWCLLYKLGTENTQTNEESVEFWKSFVQEVQRLRPILPVGYPRRVLYSTQLFGFTMPRNALLLTNIHESHQDDSNWTNPRAFDPKRFLGAPTQSYEAWLPFGTGRRFCIGSDLAFKILYLSLFNISDTYAMEVTNIKSLSVDVKTQGLLQIPKSSNVKFKVNRHSLKS